MTDDQPTREQSPAAAIRYAAWPIDGIAEARYLGLADDAANPTPMVYHMANHAVYEGRLDDGRERITLDEQPTREFADGTTITDVIAAIADDVGWASLSAWARERAGTEPTDVDHVEFQRETVRDGVAHEYGFFGSYTFADETGRAHTIERQFRVYPDATDEPDTPGIAVEETHLVAQSPDEERRAGEADRVGQTETVLRPTIDSDAETAEGAVHDWCRDWHESLLDHPVV